VAITTNDTILKYGTQDLVTSQSPQVAQVSNGAFSAATDVVDWTNDDDAPLAAFTLVLNDLSGDATAGDTVDLYCKPLKITTNSPQDDHEGPSTTIKSIYLGSFLVDSGDPGASNEAYLLGPVALPGTQTSQVYEFYIFNNLTTVNITAAAWELWVTPISFGPHA